MALTDGQLEYVLAHLPTGERACGVNLRDPQRCEARTIIIDGKVEMAGMTCGEPCDFVCDNWRKLVELVEYLQTLDYLMDRAREKVK